MKINDLIQKIYQANKEAYAQAQKPLRSHGPNHHLHVCLNALKIAEGKQVDKEVLVAAALLHDISAYYPEVSQESYHDYDFVYAEKILKSINFGSNKIQLVLEAIKNHGSDPKYKDEKEPLEVTILRDADKMEIFGALGIARIIMVRTEKGDSLEEIVDDFYTKGHLERKWNSVTSKEIKELLQKDYDYSMDFLRRLKESLELRNINFLDLPQDTV